MTTDRTMQIRNLIAKHGPHTRAHALYLAGLCESAGLCDAILGAVNSPDAAKTICDLVERAKQSAAGPAADEAVKKITELEERQQESLAENEQLRQRIEELEAENTQLKSQPPGTDTGGKKKSSSKESATTS